jgi:hypothetical protein
VSFSLAEFPDSKYVIVEFPYIQTTSTSLPSGRRCYSSYGTSHTPFAPLTLSSAALVILLVAQHVLQLVRAFDTFSCLSGRASRCPARFAARSRLWYPLLPLWSSYSSCSTSCSSLAPLVPSPAALGVLLLFRASGTSPWRSGRTTRCATCPTTLFAPLVPSPASLVVLLVLQRVLLLTRTFGTLFYCSGRLAAPLCHWYLLPDISGDLYCVGCHATRPMRHAARRATNKPPLVFFDIPLIEPLPPHALPISRSLLHFVPSFCGGYGVRPARSRCCAVMRAR